MRLGLLSTQLGVASLALLSLVAADETKVRKYQKRDQGVCKIRTKTIDPVPLTTSVSSITEAAETQFLATEDLETVIVASTITEGPAPQSTTATTSEVAAQTTETAEAEPNQAQVKTAGDDGIGKTSAAAMRELLDIHNAERARYGALPLTWSNKLEQYAYDYAEGCPKGHSHGPYGENLAGGPAKFSIQVLAGMWVAEHKPEQPLPTAFGDGSKGHWSQVVWKGTKELGCSYVDCGGSVLTCEYFPAGNVLGGYGGNIGEFVG